LTVKQLYEQNREFVKQVVEGDKASGPPSVEILTSKPLKFRNWPGYMTGTSHLDLLDPEWQKKREVGYYDRALNFVDYKNSYLMRISVTYPDKNSQARRVMNEVWNVMQKSLRYVPSRR
jgi:hypothetical protein